MDVHCLFCNRITIIWSWDDFNAKLSNLYIHKVLTSLNNLLLNGTMPSIYFINETYKNITYVSYPPTFENPCPLSNDQCYYNQNDTNNEIIFNKIDLSNNYYNNTNVMIILYEINNVTFHPPIMTNDLSYVSIICFYCYQIQFNLSKTSNVALTLISTLVNGVTDSNIIGPNNNFILNWYGNSMWGSDEQTINFYINNTHHISANGIHQSNVYLGNNLNM